MDELVSKSDELPDEAASELSAGLGGPELGPEPESMAAQHDRYRMTLEGIKARLAMTDVPKDDWVKTLHGEIYALAAYALRDA